MKSLLDLGLIVAHVSWGLIINPRKVFANKLWLSVMAEYKKDCDLTCYACSCRCDLEPHKNKFKLSNRTAEKYSSGYTERSDQMNRMAENDSSGQSTIAECMSCDSSGQLTTGSLSYKDRALPVLPPDEVAVVLSTSGTTDDPVTILVPHSSIIPNILDLRSRFNMTSDDVVFNASPLTFDPSIVEVHRVSVM